MYVSGRRQYEEYAADGYLYLQDKLIYAGIEPGDAKAALSRLQHAKIYAHLYADVNLDLLLPPEAFNSTVDKACATGDTAKIAAAYMLFLMVIGLSDHGDMPGSGSTPAISGSGGIPTIPTIGGGGGAPTIRALLPPGNVTPKMIKHHIFNKFRGSSPNSQVYRNFFKKHGINVDNYTVEIPESLHKHLHKSGNNWTTRWKNWIDANPNATTKEVYQFAGSLMDEYGLNHLPIVKYR
jgi:hypothetical protein